MDAVKLYKKYTIEELQKMMEDIQNDPKNKTTGELYLYTKSARKKTDAISWAIAYHLKDLRKERGEEISEGQGYTGRKQNKR